MSTGVEIREIAEDDTGLRLDRWFKEHYPDLPYGRLQKLLRTGQVRVNGKRVKADARLQAGAQVRIPPLDSAKASKKSSDRSGRSTVSAEDAAWIKTAILYRDDWVIAINKPAGLAVQGGSKTSRHLDGMLDALKFKAAERPRLVHRLDKDTSGVLLLARNRKAARTLTRAFGAREVEKEYWALVVGRPARDEGKISSNLAKGEGPVGERMINVDEGQKAITDFVVIDHAAGKASWLALMPRTGRTHQLRVHCAAMETPIVGDGKYGGAGAHIDGLPNIMHLHARSLTFMHPEKGRMTVSAPLPDHMRVSWDLFEFDENAADGVFDE